MFLMHLYLNIDFDWHINDKDDFIVLNNKEGKYNIFRSDDENSDFSARSREYYCVGVVFSGDNSECQCYQIFGSVAGIKYIMRGPLSFVLL